MDDPTKIQETDTDAQVVDQNADANVDADVKADATKEQDGANVNQDDTKKETGETKKVSIIDKIANIIRRKPDDGTTDDDTNADGTDKGKDVPAEFTTAAIKAGMTPQMIEEFTSDYTDAELLEQIPHLLAQVSENSDKSEQLSQKETGDAQVAEKKDDEGTDEKDEKIKLLEERLAKVEKGQETSTAKEVQDRFISMASRATKRMDELSKEFEVFGVYEKLPRFPHNNQVIPSSPAMKARNEVWVLATDLANKAGMDFDTALEISVNAYKGKNLANDVKRNLVKDLKRNEKRLSAKHSAHESVKTDLSGPDVIREVGKKHGLEIR